MSLKLNNSNNRAPFFPPGIACHRMVSSTYGTKEPLSKRPQTVKECKNLSKNKRNLITSSLSDYGEDRYRLRRFSSSTPNLKVCHTGDREISSLPKHNCNMGIADHADFKASPLPPYYSSESLERNRSLFDHNFSTKQKSRSLDRLSSTNKSKNLTGFVPERPFYPPSKYPNIHCKSDENIQRLIETRDRYKTPQSRKLVCRVSGSKKVDNSGLTKSNQYNSVPNLNRNNRKVEKPKLNLNNDSFRDFYGDQMAYTSEIGPYRRSDKLDMQVSEDFTRNSSEDMYSSYFYPRPIPTKRTSNINDRMAQSLILERSVASMIFTGSLDRATRNDPLRKNNEVTDLDDSPTKSKRLNSFSQDSLDGHKLKPQQQSTEKSIEQNSANEKCSTISLLEDDEQKTLCSSHSDFLEQPGSQFFMDNLQCKDELDQYNIDQMTKQNLTVKDFSSFTYSGKNSPISIGNDFLSNRDRSIIGKDDQTLLSDLASKCIVSTNHITDEYSDLYRKNGHSMIHDGESDVDGVTIKNSDRSALEDNTLYGTKGTDPHIEHTFRNCDENLTEISKLNNLKHGKERNSKYNPITDQFCDQMLGPDADGSNQISRPGYHYEGILARDQFLIQNDRENGGNLSFNSPFNQHRNISGSMYDNRVIPDIDLEGDMDASESSSANELTWSRYDENKSCRDYGTNSVPMQRNDVPWASSPELHSARYGGYTRHPTRHLQSENPLKPLCSYCQKPAYFMERISISNIIFHKSCFRCRKCGTHLNFNNCILHRHRPYCLVHVRSKIWKSVRSASAKKLNQIKERLDNKSNLQRQGSTEAKQPKRIFYEGMKSAKTKFLEDATKAKEVQVRSPKRITPPRQGINSGIVESEPKPRDPNVIVCRDSQTSYYDEMTAVTQSNSTKETRDRFKELENKSNTKEIMNGDADDSGLSRRPDVIPVDTKSLRNRFLEAANDGDTKLKKINPTDEIQRMALQETNSIYENEPESRTDVIKSNSQMEDEVASPMLKNRAKEMKDKFNNIIQDDKPKKSKFKLEYGEGGVYESNPQENNDDVVKHNYDTTVILPENTVKSGLQRIKELQDIKSQGFQKTNKEPIKFEADPSVCGIYENTPEQSRADSISYQNESSVLEFREKNYANDAKKVFMDKQKLNEEASTKKCTPQMIDIWKDLCPDSGIFENEPKEQRKDVVKYEYNMDELMVVQSENIEVNGKDDVQSTERNEENNIHSDK